MATKTLAVEQRQILWACYAYWKASDHLPDVERVFCHNWVSDKFRDRFGGAFHQSQLAKLCRAGLLTEGHLAQGGGRRYYGLADPAAVRELVAEFDLPSQG